MAAWQSENMPTLLSTQEKERLAQLFYEASFPVYPPGVRWESLEDRHKRFWLDRMERFIESLRAHLLDPAQNGDRPVYALLVGWMDKVRAGEELTLEERVERLELAAQRLLARNEAWVERDEPGGFDDQLGMANAERRAANERSHELAEAALDPED